MKKSIIITLCVALLLAFSATTVLAQDMAEAQSVTGDITIQRYTNIQSVTAYLSISGGKATAGGDVSAKATNNITVLVELQQLQSNGSWKTLDSWSDSKKGTFLSVTGSCSAPSGFTYRTKVTGTVAGETGYAYAEK